MSDVFKGFYLKVQRTKESAKLPTRGTAESAGLDFYTPIDVEIPVDGQVVLPLGIKVEMKEGFVLFLDNKSGVSTKKQIIRGACVTGDTFIKTTSGEKRADDIGPGEMILSYNIQSDLSEIKKCDGFRTTGLKECVKITFDDGTELMCSSDHSIKNSKLQWIEAGDLKIGDDVLELN